MRIYKGLPKLHPAGFLYKQILVIETTCKAIEAIKAIKAIERLIALIASIALLASIA